MINGIQWKVCGLTNAADAAAAAGCGADYLGFILVPQSPRGVTLGRFATLEPGLPDLPKVAVSVEPAPKDLAAMEQAGFDFFQVHFRHDLPPSRLEGWSQAVGAERLWLAPRLPAAVEVPAGWLPLARFFLMDAFRADRFGGTGRTSDWDKFSNHRRKHPEQVWILAGSLNAENIAEALRQSGARFVDASSGLESAPGVKDPAKMAAFAAALRAPAAGA